MPSLSNDTLRVILCAHVPASRREVKGSSRSRLGGVSRCCVQVSVISLGPRVWDTDRQQFEHTWNGTIGTTPPTSAFYFPNVFSTAFNDTYKPYYLYDLTSSGSETTNRRRAAVLAAISTATPVSTPKLGQYTAAGNRTGISTDIFAPIYLGGVDVLGTCKP